MPQRAATAGVEPAAQHTSIGRNFAGWRWRAAGSGRRGAQFQRLDPGIQPALITSRLVLVDQAFVGGAVDDGYAGFIGGISSLGIASLQRLDRILDIGAERRPNGHVVSTTGLRLAGAFTGLC